MSAKDLSKFFTVHNVKGTNSHSVYYVGNGAGQIYAICETCQTADDIDSIAAGMAQDKESIVKRSG